jgi:geranylgeranyl diphosphate synthase, type I
MQIKEYRMNFDKNFEKLIAKIIQSADKKSDQNSRKFIKQIQNLAKGGKRIRPFLVHLIHKGYGGKENIFNYEASYELVHLFALIHDDIMDDAPTRHNEKTLHQYTKEDLLFAKMEKDRRRRLAEAYGILGGDLIFLWANKIFQEGKNKNHKEASRVFYDMLEELTIGQMFDIVSPASEIFDTKSLISKSQMKSGHYTFTRPMELGAVLAGIDNTEKNKIKKIGEKIGLVFQASDDLIDVLSNKAISGKENFTDIKEGQQTILTSYFFSLASKGEKEKFLKYFNKNKTLKETEKKEILSLFEKTNTFKEVRAFLEKETQDILKMIDKTKLQNKEKEILKELTIYIKERNA